MSPERTPVLYFCRCGWCGAYEGTVDPNEACPIDPATGEPLGPHQFGIYERLAAPDEDVPRPSHAGADLPDGLPF